MYKGTPNKVSMNVYMQLREGNGYEAWQSSFDPEQNLANSIDSQQVVMCVHTTNYQFNSIAIM